MIFWSDKLTAAHGRTRVEGGYLVWEQTGAPHAGHLVGYRKHDGEIHPFVGGLVVPEPCEATRAPEFEGNDE